MAPVETTLILSSGFILGLSHAFEVDHLTAVSAFVALKPKPKQALKFGVHWAVGHGFSLLLFGSILFGLKLAVSDAWSHLLERIVGAALFAVGLFMFWKLGRGLAKPHKHEHRGSIVMGMLHGLAGTAAFVGQAFVVAAQSYSHVVGFTLAFSLGVLCSMAVYAHILGKVLVATQNQSRQLSRSVQVFTALWTCGVGAFWMLRV